MPRLVKIAQVNDVPPGQAACLEVDGQRIALFNVAGTHYAIEDTCSHSGGPLSEGEVSGTRVKCPWHGADFDLSTGAALSAPACERVKCFKIVLEGDDIKIEI